MNSIHRKVDDFRLKREFHRFSVHWLCTLTVLLLLAAHVSCRSSDHEFADADVDNIQWYPVKMVDGVGQREDHPVIFYKEDFVSEDYDPGKERKKNTTSTRRLRKYKEISRRHRYNRTNAEQYRALKPEKIYFDVLPQAPVVLADDSSASDSKFDPSKIRVEILSLVDDTIETEAGDGQSKQILNKRPKKYRRRQRRDTSEDGHEVYKRNPSYLPTDFNRLLSIFQNFGPTNQQSNSIRHPVKGIYYNTISPPGPQRAKPAEKVDIMTRFGDENESDRVIWGAKQSGQITTRRPPPPLFHNSNPQNWDISFVSPTRPPMTTTTGRALPPLFHNSNPENWDTSFLRPQNMGSGASFVGVAAQTEQAAASQTEEPQLVSECVWAIVSCCSRQNLNIRNECFEAMNCGRNFWGLNPCSDAIQDKALLHVDKFLD